MHRAGFAAVVTLLALGPFLVHPGIPLFLHDWVWSPFAARDVWTAHFLYSSWKETGLGEPNSAPSVNPLAWAKVALPLFLSGKAALVAYLFFTFAFAVLGVCRIARHNLGMDAGWSLVAGALFAGSPFEFNKIASGQSSYWAATAAFAWGLSFCLTAFEKNCPRAALRSAIAFALASVQMQFLAFAWIAYAIGAATFSGVRRAQLAAAGALASLSLAMPTLVFLALRGPEHGAAISPMYALWLKSQSATPREALATIGYAARYVERSLALAGVPVRAVTWPALLLAAAALTATIVDRRRPAVFLGVLALVGFAWTTGVEGPAALLWDGALAHLGPAVYFREFYHGAVLYAVPLCVLAALGFQRLSRFLPLAARLTALVCTFSFGAATWTWGLGRILPFTPVPSTHSEFAQAFGKPAGRVLFLPAQQPLAKGKNDIGGNDGLDWIDANHLSPYEYYLHPLLVYVEATLRDGNAAPAKALLPRLGCVAVVFRPKIHSVAYESAGAGDRSELALRRGFGAPVYADRDHLVFALRAYPVASLARRVDSSLGFFSAPATDPSVVYGDIPGIDAADEPPEPRPERPDPALGWIGRRDAPVWLGDRLPAPSYGIVTTRPGATAMLNVPRDGNALVWSPAGIELGEFTVRAPALRRIAVSRGAMQISAHGPSLIAETGEDAVTPPQQLHARLERFARVAPWEYRMRLYVDGRAALVIREAFDPAWRLEGSGVTIEAHERADGFGNLFILRGHGAYELRMTYAWQGPTELLLGLSLAAFLATFAYAFAPRPRSPATPPPAPGAPSSN